MICTALFHRRMVLPGCCGLTTAPQRSINGAASAFRLLFRNTIRRVKMNRRKFCTASALAVAALPAAAKAQTAAPSAGDQKGDARLAAKQSRDESELLQLEKQFAEAAARGDAAAIQRRLAPGYFAVDAAGTEMTAEQALGRMRMPGYVVESLRHDQVRVRSLRGDCAVVTAQTTLRAKFQGRDVSGEYPYLRLWQRHAQGWLALVTVGYPAKPKPAAQDNSPNGGAAAFMACPANRRHKTLTSIRGWGLPGRRAACASATDGAACAALWLQSAGCARA
jgi:ketosteroid isomerase-like protein